MSLLQIYLQVGDLRKKDLILTVTDNDIQRGHIGLGTNRLKNVWFSSLTVQPRTKAAVTEVRSYDKCLANVSPTHIRKYCDYR